MEEVKNEIDQLIYFSTALAHGHPLGATGNLSKILRLTFFEGAVLMTKLVNELERQGKRYGLQAMPIGHGMAIATIIENCSFDSRISKL